jgi:O-acetyl-ADP-ribose deacetylase (regulator of RNase III)
MSLTLPGPFKLITVTPLFDTSKLLLFLPWFCVRFNYRQPNIVIRIGLSRKRCQSNDTGKVYGEVEQTSCTIRIINQTKCHSFSMKIEIKNADIAKASEDALIYSTNKALMLSGGAGAALANEYGNDIQTGLYKLAESVNKTQAELGDVFISKNKQVPWKLLFHTVVTDEEYNTSINIVKSVLVECFDVCDQTYGITHIAISALGCGFGDCSHTNFIKLLKNVAKDYDDTDLLGISVYCRESVFFEEMKGELAR